MSGGGRAVIWRELLEDAAAAEHGVETVATEHGAVNHLGVLNVGAAGLEYVTACGVTIPGPPGVRPAKLCYRCEVIDRAVTHPEPRRPLNAAEWRERVGPPQGRTLPEMIVHVLDAIADGSVGQLRRLEGDPVAQLSAVVRATWPELAERFPVDDKGRPTRAG